MAGQGGAPFDFSALSSVLNDPSIREMAESIASNPAFAQMTQSLQASLLGGDAAAAGAAAAGGSGASSAGGSSSAAAAGGSAAAGAPPGMPPIDPSKYAEVMSSVMGNADFLSMAEKLGKQIMQADPGMASLMASMQSPEAASTIESRLASLKEDPELAPILKEIETGGPTAMMKYWNDPAVLEKLSKAMGGAFGGAAGIGGAAGAGGKEGGEEGEAAADGEGEDDDGAAPTTVLDAATKGDHDALQSLLDSGLSPDDVDEENRSALHFASGYGELECVRVLLKAGAKRDLADGNGNTALHYAAGYGQPECVMELLASGADANIKNKEGKDAALVAKLNGSEEIAEMLGGGGGEEGEGEEGDDKKEKKEEKEDEAEEEKKKDGADDDGEKKAVAKE